MVNGLGDGKEGDEHGLRSPAAAATGDPDASATRRNTAQPALICPRGVVHRRVDYREIEDARWAPQGSRVDALTSDYVPISDDGGAGCARGQQQRAHHETELLRAALPIDFSQEARTLCRNRLSTTKFWRLPIGYFYSCRPSSAGAGAADAAPESDASTGGPARSRAIARGARNGSAQRSAKTRSPNFSYSWKLFPTRAHSHCVLRPSS
jgi:hypothetical protein